MSLVILLSLYLQLKSVEGLYSLKGSYAVYHSIYNSIDIRYHIDITARLIHEC